MAIADQRTMTGLAIHEAPETVVAEWERYAASHGRVLTHTRKRLQAYVSDSRWVADCPNCNGGIACWIENPEGCCLDCGHVYKIVFPKDWREVERVLEPRPPANRHMLPGQTLEDLKVENLTHGVPLEQPTVEG